MKKYSTSTGYKYWTLKLAKIAFLLLVPQFFFNIAHSENKQSQKHIFSETEREIIDSEILRFKKECTHISILDETKLQDIQKFYSSKKDILSIEQNNCVENNMTQLVATHNIYKQTCDEITPQKNIINDADASRLFVNVRKFQNGIRSYHEKLNECLIRNGAQRDLLLPFTDYEGNNRLLSKKLREIDLSPPFKENGVEYR